MNAAENKNLTCAGSSGSQNVGPLKENAIQLNPEVYRCFTQVFAANMYGCMHKLPHGNTLQNQVTAGHHWDWEQVSGMP